MPLQGILLLLFIIVILPIIIFFEDPNFFFVLVALILLITSLRSLYRQVFQSSDASEDIEEGILEEMEDSFQVNMKRFSMGIGVARNLIILLFLGYCTFFLHHFYIKILAAAVMTFWVIETFRLVYPQKDDSASGLISGIRIGFCLVMDLSMVLLIVFVFFNKYLGLIL